MKSWAMALAALVFAVVFASHFGYQAFQETHVANQWVQVSAPATSAWFRYVERGDYWFGYSYALAAAFTAFALTLIIRKRRQAAQGVVGGVTLLGILYGAGCFLIGCCGSPMLAVYLTLFGSSVLGLLKPLVAIVTTVSVAVTAMLVLRRARTASCPTCAPTPGGPRAVSSERKHNAIQ